MTFSLAFMKHAVRRYFDVTSERPSRADRPVGIGLRERLELPGSIKTGTEDASTTAIMAESNQNHQRVGGG